MPQGLVGRVVAAVVLALSVPVSAPAGATGAEPPNPWLEQRVLNMPHSGGEDEAPSNTMYAFARAIRKGGDMIELDVQSTRDGRLVVIHDATVDASTNGTGRVEVATAQHTTHRARPPAAGLRDPDAPAGLRGLPGEPDQHRDQGERRQRRRVVPAQRRAVGPLPEQA